MRFLRKRKRRDTWQASWKRYEAKMSFGWWLSHDIIVGDKRHTLEVLVEPEEVGPILNMLKRNGIEEGQSARLAYGIGQTALQQRESRRTPDGK